LELDAVVGAVLELGDKLGVPMPHTRSVFACARLLNEVSLARSAAKDGGQL